MKKKWLAAALACMMSVSAFVLAGCADSAYDIAVKNGFTGTEKEWLESLKGADGDDAPNITIRDVYDAAVADGSFTGTFSEFLKDYLSLTVPENNNVEILAKNILSTVSIYTGFSVTTKNQYGFTTTKVECTAGSGVIIDLDRENGNATVITNYHVVYDKDASGEDGIAGDIWLYLYGGRVGFSTKTGKDEGGDGIKAQFVGGSMDYDIAILEIAGSDILKASLAEEAKFGDSNEAAVGEKVFVVGNPQGSGISVSQGVLSVDSEYIGMKSLDGTNRTVSYRVMRTDAAVNGGNSGGPMFNSAGELIAIINAKSIADGVENMGYALPAAQVLGVMENVKNHGGSIKRATLGIMVEIQDTSVSVKTDGTLKITEKLRVDSITLNTAAFGRLQVDDILKSVTLNGVTYPLDRRFYLNDLLLKVKKGDVLTLTVERDGQEREVLIPFSYDYYFADVQ
jgi:S1-C subfamily serine protease